MKLIGIGDNVCDRYLNLGQMFPGGQALNVAAFAAMDGQEAAYIGVFGSDETAQYVQNELDIIGVDYSFSRYANGENGYAEVNLVNGDRIFVKSNKGGVLKKYPLILSDDDLEYIRQFDLVHTSNNSYFDEELKKLKSQDLLISYDISTQWQDEKRLARIAPLVDFLFLSCSGEKVEDLKSLALQINKLGCPYIMMTMGAEGALFYDGQKFYRSFTKPLEVIDTLGAGDAFTAGFLTVYTPGLLIKSKDNLDELTEKALENASQLATQVCMRYGAFGMGKNLGCVLKKENF